MKKTIFILSLILSSLALQSQNIETVVQRSAGDICNTLAISADGQFLAKVNYDQSTEIEIWSIKTGQFVRSITTSNGNNAGEQFLKSISQVHFWKGSKCVVTATSDGVHEIYDVRTGKKINTLCSQSYIGGVSAVNEKTGTFAAIHPLDYSKSMLIFIDLFNNIKYDSINLNVGLISALEFSPDGKKMAIGTEKGSFYILELNGFKETHNVENAHPSKINYLQWTADNYLLVSDTTNYSLWNLNKNSITSNGRLGAGACIVSDPVEDCFYIANSQGILQKTGDGSAQKWFGIKPDNVQKIDFANNTLYVLTDHFVKTFDLNNVSQASSEKMDSIMNTFSSPDIKAQWIKNFSFIPAKKSYAMFLGNQFIVKGIDSNINDRKVPFLFPGLTSVTRISDNKLVYIENGISLKGINLLENGQHSLINSTREESIIAVSPFGNQCIGAAVKGAIDSIISVYDLATKQRIPVSVSGKVYCGTYSTAKQQYAVGGEKLFVVDALTNKAIRLFDAKKEKFNSGYGNASFSIEIPERYNQLCFSADGNKLYASSLFGQLKIWNLATMKIDTVLNLKVSSMIPSSDGKRMFIATNNEILMLKTSDYSLEARIALLEKGDYIFSLRDNYYKSSRNGSKAIAFRKGSQTYSFEQFDVVYNQPDIVTQRIGNPSSQMLEALKKAKLKRLKKMGFTEEVLQKSDLNAPEISIVNYNKIPTNTQNPNLPLTVTAIDKVYSLSRFYMYVNGVPTSETSLGYDLKSSNVNGKINIPINFNFNLPLDEGKNLIEVSCMNEKGIESLRESFEIYYTPEISKKPDLYVIGIGVSQYKDSTNNLKYPVKDINDIIKALNANSSLFEKVNVTQLTDKEVTKESVMALKQKLVNSKVGDYAYVFWSGHGLLSKDLDYYLATSDIDFNNPELKGMDYSTLESIFEGVPARKKVLFIDACNSGEVDKEGSVLMATTNTVQGKISSRGFKQLENKENGLGLKNSFELMQELFSDVRRGTGANIISAAGGAEFALEGDDWNNGVFTYSLLSGLKNKKADLNSDGNVMLSELQEYLQDQVFKLTQGKQKPTSRVENLYNDFPVSGARVARNTTVAPPKKLPVQVEPQIQGNTQGCNLFPLYGIMLGKTTEQELSGMGTRSTYIDKTENQPYKYYTVNELNFWYENSIVDHMYMTYSDPMPQQWKDCGIDWQLSYNDLKSGLENHGFQVTITKTPESKTWDGRQTLSAEITAIKRITSEITINFRFKFDYGSSNSLDAQKTLYSISVRTAAPANNNTATVATTNTNTTSQSNNSGGWTNCIGNAKGYLYSVWGSSAYDVFVAGSNGLMRSSNRGENWRTVLPDLITYVYGVSSTDLYAGGRGLYHSVDGENWTKQLDEYPPIEGILSIAPGKIMAVSQYGDIYITTNSGQNWSRTQLPVFNSTPAVSRAIVTAGSIIVAGEHGVVLRSTDGGVTWNQSTFPSTKTVVGLWSPPDHPTWVYASTNTENGKCNVSRSFDGGASWSSWLSIVIDSNFGNGAMWGVSSNDFYLMFMDDFLHTTDGGKTWENQKMGGSFYMGLGTAGNDLYFLGLDIMKRTSFKPNSNVSKVDNSVPVLNIPLPTSPTNVPSKKVQEGAQGCNLFPLFGITLGKTTVNELAGLAPGATKNASYDYYKVNDVNFWFDNTIITHMYIVNGIYPLPKPWVDCGFNWDLSYNEWKSLFEKKGYSIIVTLEPQTGTYSNKPSFNAKFKATKNMNNGVSIVFEMSFQYSEGTTVYAKQTLYSISVKGVDSPISNSYQQQTKPSVKAVESSGGNCNFFPVYGIMLGKTTVDELSRLGTRTTTIQSGTEPYKIYVVNAVDFWYDDNVATHMYMTHYDALPKPWMDCGFDWTLSFNDWKSLLQSWGFSVSVTKEPESKTYSGRETLAAELTAIKIVNSETTIKFRFNFNYGKANTVDAKETLYALSVNLVK